MTCPQTGGGKGGGGRQGMVAHDLDKGVGHGRSAGDARPPAQLQAGNHEVNVHKRKTTHTPRMRLEADLLHSRGVAKSRATTHRRKDFDEVNPKATTLWKTSASIVPS